MCKTTYYITTTFKEFEATNYELFLRCIKGKKNLVTPLFVLPSCQYSSTVKYTRHNLDVKYSFDTNQYPGFLQVLHTIPKRPTRKTIINKENTIIKYNTNNAFKKKFKLSLHVTHIFPVTEEVIDFKKKHIQNMIKHMKSLHLNSNFSDQNLILDDSLFPVHRIILSAHSSVFECMFLFRMNDEQTQKEKNITLVQEHLPYLNYESFSVLLRYIYTEDIEKMDKIGSELIFVADMYKIMYVVELCKQALIENINEENAVEIYLIADQLNLNDLTDFCIEYMKEKNIPIPEGEKEKSE